MSNIEPQRLARFASTVYKKAGVPRDDAAVIADTLVQADQERDQSRP